MNFMCEKHRKKLSEDSKAATIVWYRLMSQARYHFKIHAWQKAIISYGNALDAAQVIFEHDSISPAVNRYIRTASELVYTIRQCDYPCDLQFIVAMVQKNLEENLYPANIKLLIRPLTDIAYAPLSEVNRWMQALYEADQQARNGRYH